jgi:hypothetical protein
MLAPAALSLSLALGAPLALQLDAGLHVEARTRSADRDVQREDVLVDLTATPAVEVEARSGHATYSARYAPGLTLSHLGARTGTERHVDVLHDGRLRYVLEPSHAWRLALTGTGARGRTDLVVQGLRGDVPAGPVPTTAVLDYQRGGAELDLLLTPDQRSRWELTGGIFTSGGTTTASRAALPLENTLTAGLAYRWAATRLDGLGFALAGRGSRFPDPGDLGAYATSLGTWTRRLSTDVTAELGAGAVWLYARNVRFDGVEERILVQRKVRPAAQLRLAADVPLVAGRRTTPAVGAGGGSEAPPPPPDERLRAEASARLGAGIDRLTAEVSQQAEGAASLTWERTHGASLVGRAYGTIAWQQLGRSETLGLELRARWVLTSYLRPEVGLYVASQRPAGPSPSFTEYGVLVAVSLDAPRQSW